MQALAYPGAYLDKHRDTEDDVTLVRNATFQEVGGRRCNGWKHGLVEGEYCTRRELFDLSELRSGIVLIGDAHWPLRDMSVDPPHMK